MADNEALNVRLSAKDDFTAIFGKMTRGLDKLVNNHKKLFVTMVAGTAIIAGAVNQAAKYERQLAKVNTMLSQGEAKFLPGYSKEMKRLAAISGQSTQTLSDGLYDILSASRGAEGAIGILAQTTRAAVGGFTDVATATSGALTTLNAFKLENSAVESVLDRQFATVKRGRLTYEQYAQTIGTLAATSSLAKQSIDSMNAAVATVTRGGISAERAIVAINGAMLAFIKPTKQASAAAKKFNVDLSQSAIEGDNLGKTLEKLKTLRADQLAQVFVERRAFKAMAVLTKDYAGFMRDLAEQHNSVGRMAEAAAKAEDTLNFQAERSLEIFKNLGRTLGGPVASALKVTLKFFNDLVKAVPEANKAIDNFIRAQQSGISPAIISAAIKGDIPALEKELQGARRVITAYDEWIKTRPVGKEGLLQGLIGENLHAKAVEAQKEIDFLVKELNKLRRAKSEVADTSLDVGAEKLNAAFLEAAFLAARTSEEISKSEEALKKIRDESLGIDEIYRKSLVKHEKTVSLHQQQVRQQAENRRAIREEADIRKEMAGTVIDQVKAAKADLALNERRTRQLEAQRILTADRPAPVRADVPLGPEVPDSIRQLNEYQALTDGKLEIDQSYWSSFAELMRTTYGEQLTLANSAATQSAAFVESAFGTLENELMKATNKRNLSMKRISQAIEQDAKRSTIRTILDVTKNKLKSIFIVEKAESASEIQKAAQAKLLRNATYADQASKVLARVYANVFSSIAAIPIVGPALAGPAAISAKTQVAAVMAKGMAHGGLDEVPTSGHNKSYILKGGERVLQPEANKEFMSLVDALKGLGLDNTLNINGGQQGSPEVRVFIGLSEIKDMIVETVNQGSKDGDISINQRAITT